jgi:hypothetical protein
MTTDQLCRAVSGIGFVPIPRRRNGCKRAGRAADERPG